MTTPITREPRIDPALTIQAARAFAATRGDHGATGGWIYNESGQPITQGWSSYSWHHRSAIRDWLTRQVTAFDSFDELMATDPRYCPTLLPRTWRERHLADLFDLHAFHTDQARRAWRGTNTPREEQAS
jgi:hypothetical protein